MKIPVFYCHIPYDAPHTGGEWAHHHTRNYLISQPDIDLQEFNSSDHAAFKTPSLKTQLWFLKRFWRLPAATIIVQASESCLQLCLANWALKLRRHRPHILILVHSDPFLKGMNWKGVLVDGTCFKTFVRSADRLVANSLDMCQRLLRLGVNREKITVITPPPQVLPRSKVAPQNNGTIQIICPSNIYAKKGQEVLIEAMQHIEDSRVTAILPGLVKDPKYRQRLGSLVKQYGLNRRITFAGYLNGQEMANAYAQSDICVVPSLHEPFGMVVQEAMLFGLPVIASRVGGLTEQIKDGVNGLLVPPGDSDALAEAIQRLSSDSDLRMTLLKNAKEKTKTFPTWESVMERTCNVVREMA